MNCLERTKVTCYQSTSKNKNTAVVVLSGGQDSVTCLMLAKKIHVNVYAIHFKYGQQHASETACAIKICGDNSIPLKIVDISFLGELVSSALTQNNAENVRHEHPYKEGLPASFVPGRNATFLTIAHAYAQEVKAGFIYTGVCQTDYSGYPDCRQNFITFLQYALNVGYETDIEILTPFMWMDKSETFEVADELGCLNTVIEDTMTCYENSLKKNEWGYGCGNCPSCQLRLNGYAKFLTK